VEVFCLVLSPLLLEETRRALLKPELLKACRHTPEAVERICQAMATLALLVGGAPGFVSPPRRDPDDHHVITAARARYLVTGDRDLRPRGAPRRSHRRGTSLTRAAGGTVTFTFGGKAPTSPRSKRRPLAAVILALALLAGPAFAADEEPVGE
jgi:hypothetical protein